jgi:outer membrane protein assembly factor BamB
MSNASRKAVLAGCVLLLGAACARAQDWPQWRGPNRDNRVAGFTEPKTWPKELTKKWSTKVGLGDASPVLVGDKLYAFTREGNDEVVWCLDAAKGSEVWKEKYAGGSVTNRAASGHPGPRSTPAVAEGKVCTLGVAGYLSCRDAANGKELWKKDTKTYPTFSTASSPIIVDGKCIAFLGKEGAGALTAFDLTSGEEKWKWTGEGPAYSSPVLMTVGDTKMLVVLGEKSLVGVGVADGKLLWQAPYGSNYSSGTPVVDGQTVICSGPPAMRGTGKGGTAAFKVEKKDGGFAATEAWKVTKAAGIYNTPVLKDGRLYGLSGRGTTTIFCLDAKDGKELWADDGKRGDCGTILDAGAVLLCLSSNGELVVFKPSDKKYEEVAKYVKVGDAPWAAPVVAGNRVFVKDKDSVILWTID